MKLQQFYYKRNRLQQLRGFYFTAQLKSVSEAAKSLGLSQSAITMQIQSLERDLKVALFDRDKKRLKLTKDGMILYQMATPYIQGVDSVCEKFLNLRQQEKKELHIAAHHIALLYLLPPYISEFTRRCPNVTLHIHNIASGEALARLVREELDLILYPNIPSGPEYDSEECFSYDAMLIMHRTHALAKVKRIRLEEIAQHNLIRVDSSLITLPLFEEVYRTYGWKGNIAFENGDWAVLKSLVRANAGIAMVSSLCVDEEDPDIIGRVMTDYFPKMTYSVATKTGRVVTASMEVFSALLREGKVLGSELLTRRNTKKSKIKKSALL